MQKIEKWRVQELALVLKDIHELLMQGNNSEWANVFLHFHHEALSILTHTSFQLESLKRLVQNIANCFDGFPSFTNLAVGQEDLAEKSGWSRDFRRAKGRLVSILTEIDRRTIEMTH